MDAALVVEALNRALGHRQVAPDQLSIPTARGSQYRVWFLGAIIRQCAGGQA